MATKTLTKPKKVKLSGGARALKNLKDMFIGYGYPYNFGMLNPENVLHLRSAMVRLAEDENFWAAIKQMNSHIELAKNIQESLKGSK